MEGAPRKISAALACPCAETTTSVIATESSATVHRCKLGVGTRTKANGCCLNDRLEDTAMAWQRSSWLSMNAALEDKMSQWQRYDDTTTPLKDLLLNRPFTITRDISHPQLLADPKQRDRQILFQAAGRWKRARYRSQMLGERGRDNQSFRTPDRQNPVRLKCIGLKAVNQMHYTDKMPGRTKIS